MSHPARLSSLPDGPDGAIRPGYRPGDHAPGIVHLGPGAFHRAHLAVYTDDALAASGGDWRIIGVSLRSTDMADTLNAQNGLYTLIERDGSGSRARLIGSLSHVIAAARDRDGAIAAMAAASTKIISLTVTEKAYGIDRSAGRVDPDHPAIAADLASPRAPSGAIGMIVEALRRRREAGTGPLTILCCDNLPANGQLLALGVQDFAARVDPALRDWIDEHAAFPSTMVDRITPATTNETLADAMRLTGCEDLAAIEAEPFRQWIIEDRFAGGRPDWQAGGAVFVANVEPYERMKLRMLNGSHSMLAYAGFLSGCVHVRDVMRRPELALLVARHMHAASLTLEPLEGIALPDYADALQERFRNPAIAHETYQIAMDGTEKLPQRIFAPALDALRAGGNIAPFAFATAAWMRYCLGRDESGAPYSLRDPREAEIEARVGSAGQDPTQIADALHNLPGFAPAELAADPLWRQAVGERLHTILERGMSDAIEAEAHRQ